MLTATSNDSRQYFVWMVALIIAAFGGRYIKDVIAFVREKLYQVFIQNSGNV